MSAIKLGKSDVAVQPVGFGANAVGGHNIYGPQDEEAGKALVKQAIDQGITLIDTAYIYGPGRSEELIGEVVAELGVRHEVVIATKGAHRGETTGRDIDNSPAFMRECVESSLRRLQTDYLDVFYIHLPDDKTPKYEAVGELQRLRETGMVRAVGVSNFSVEQLLEADRDGYVDVIQNEYNLFAREPEQTLLPLCVQRAISFIPYFPLASGLLTGKYADGRIPDASRSAYLPAFSEQCFADNVAKVSQLQPIAQKHGCEIQHIALAWCLNVRGIDAIIPGAKNSAQLASNLRAATVTLDEQDLNTIAGIFAI
jgi:aryl-alcohol dehydrogenase-like predicted oxidoreductase